MSDQRTPTGAGAYDRGASLFMPPPAVPEPEDQLDPTPPARPERRRTLLAWAGPVLAVLAVVSTYAVLRWSPEPVLVALAVAGTLLVALTVLGVVAARRGVVAPYVAVALLLPYLLAASAVLGSAERVSSEFEDLFGSDDESGNPTFDRDESDTAASAGEPDPADAAVPFGSTGEFEGFQVTVDRVKCGLTRIKDAAKNPRYYEVDDAEPRVDATPEDGKTFCLVRSTWMNASKNPATRYTEETFTSVVDADGVRFEPSEDDQSSSDILTRRAGHEDDTVNPGDTIQVRTVVSVPEGTQLRHLVASGYSTGVEETTWFEASAD